MLGHSTIQVQDLNYAPKLKLHNYINYYTNILNKNHTYK